MKLLDIFKRNGNRKTSSLTLELLLKKAASEPIFREEFYKRLLTDELIVIIHNSQIPHGDTVLKEDTSVNIIKYEDGTIPVFTSTDRIFDKGVVKEQVEYMQMTGENLFSLAKGAKYILNPYSDYGKEFLPDEIERLLDGTIMTDTVQTMKIEKETKVQIGQPAKYPTEITNSLKKLFTEKSNVKAAYLGWIYVSDSREPAHYIFGIDIEGDWGNLTQEAGSIAKQFLEQHEFVDFIKIDNKGGVCDYFLKETKQFYER
jgi:hypothetical protein